MDEEAEKEGLSDLWLHSSSVELLTFHLMQDGVSISRQRGLRILPPTKIPKTKDPPDQEEC